MCLDTAVRAYQKGFGLTIACEKGNVKNHQLNYELKRREIPAHKYNKVYGPDRIEFMKLQRLAGMTFEAIAKSAGISIATAYRYVTTD